MRNAVRLKAAAPIVLALVALFFALGGQATGKTRKTPPCAGHAVKGVVYVTGDPSKGIANLPQDFSAAANLFAFKFNCSGGAVQARHHPGGGADVRLVGNPANIGIATGVGEPMIPWVTHNADGSFTVKTFGRVAGGGFDFRDDMQFILVVL
jgi:hypothetical protein